MTKVLVVAELQAGAEGTAVRKATLELVTIARSLGEVAVLVCGAPGEPAAVAGVLGEYGAATVFAAEAPEYAAYLSLPKAEAVVAVAAQYAPQAVLITSGPEGKDVAARVAVRLGAGIITDATAVAVDGGTITATQSIVAGQWVSTSAVTTPVAVVTVRPNAVTAEPAAAAGAAAIESVPVAISEAAKAATVDDRSPKVSTGRPDLTDAALVVCGGRGVGSQDGYAVVEALADSLGAAVGATRAVTDLHWADHDMQIGQTGKTVAPALYVAAGVSGAIQHRAGMQSSKTIVAVNTDPKAPIFAIADFGVVGDLHKVLPALTAEISSRKA